VRKTVVRSNSDVPRYAAFKLPSRMVVEIRRSVAMDIRDDANERARVELLDVFRDAHRFRRSIGILHGLQRLPILDADDVEFSDSAARAMRQDFVSFALEHSKRRHDPLNKRDMHIAIVGEIEASVGRCGILNEDSDHALNLFAAAKQASTSLCVTVRFDDRPRLNTNCTPVVCYVKHLWILRGLRVRLSRPTKFRKNVFTKHFQGPHDHVMTKAVDAEDYFLVTHLFELLETLDQKIWGAD
jgi:hypothetical protein